MKFKVIGTVFISIAVLAACVQTPSPSVGLSPLAQWQAGTFTPKTALTTSPRIQEGVLGNGLRYFIIPNQTPKNEVVVRMRVGVGSMYETPNEAGIAHFLEHMAFNGSTNVPEGEMIAILERYGLKFGADTNASTGFEETIYKLDLPNNNVETIDTALFLMRETASNLTITDDAVSAEIPVVKSEYESRNNIYMDAYKASLQEWTDGLEYINRFPIGSLETIARFSAPAVRDFYTTHYFPANTQLIIAGDIDADDIQGKIEKVFADWQNAQAPTKFDAGMLSVNDSLQVASFSGPNLPTQVNLFYVTPEQLAPDTILNRRKDFVEQIANGILSYRLNSLVLAGNAPFEGVGSSHSFTFNQLDLTQVIAQTQPEKWAESLTTLVVEIRKIMEFGISEQELIREVKATRNALVTAAQSEATIPSSSLANAVLSNIPLDGVLNESSQSLDIFQELMATFSAEEINKVLRSQFMRVEPTIFMQFSQQALALPTTEQIIAVYQQAMTLPIQANVEKEVAKFAYTEFGQPGTVKAKSYDEVYDYYSYTFTNGVHLNVKSTDLAQEKVLIDVSYGDGIKTLTPEQAGMQDLYNFYIVGGLGKHSVNELRELLSDKNVSLNFNADLNSYGGTFSTSTDTLTTQLQLITAYMTDPGYSDSVLPLFRKNVEQGAKQRKNTIGAVKSYEVVNAIYGNDYRIGSAPTEAILQRDFTELKPILDQALQQGPLMVTVVGDVDVTEIVAEVAATLGSLPIQVAAPQHRWLTDIALQTGTEFTLYHAGNPENASVTRYFKTTDNQDLTKALQLKILGAVVQLKVQDVIREQLGAAYSPSARAFGSNSIKGDGMLLLDTLTTPDQITLVQSTYDALIAGLKTPGNITDDEVKRAIEPMLANWKTAKEQNSFWLSRLKVMHTRSDSFARFEAQPGIYAQITPEVLTLLAREYLTEKNKIEVVVLPEVATKR
jgi:zinc protease